eukprot:NODE_121_length_18880_cov_0.205687.p5 type:complete len:262 gc:universal NODE_121_length_18880_cov_0.205687:1922-2707(+)
MVALNYDAQFVIWNATHTFCEGHTGEIEFVNILTSTAMIFVGALLFGKIHNSSMLMLASISFMLNGIASIFYHLTRYFSYGIIDKTSLTLTALFILFHHLDTTWLKSSNPNLKILTYIPIMSVLFIFTPYMTYVGIYPGLPPLDVFPLIIYYALASFSGLAYLMKSNSRLLKPFLVTQFIFLFMFFANYFYELECTPITRYVPAHAVFHIVESVCTYRLAIISYCLENNFFLNFKSRLNHILPVPEAEKSELITGDSSVEL